MSKPDPSGNSWTFIKISMYPTFDSQGLYYSVVLSFIDDNKKVLYTLLNREGYPTHLDQLPWEL